MMRFYAGKWPTLDQYVLFLGEFEPGQPIILGDIYESRLFKLVEVINIYHGTFAFDSIHGTHVVDGDFQVNTFDVGSFWKARQHLVELLAEQGRAHLKVADEYFAKAAVVLSLEKYPHE